MTRPSENYGMIRCDDEFEVIDQDLDMSTMGIVQRSQPYVAPDISRELVLLDAHFKNSAKNKEDKHMYPIGTKIYVRASDDYQGRYSGQTGIVCKHYLKTNRIGVMLDGRKNPDSKSGIFWFQEKSLMPYDKLDPLLSTDDVKNVVFSGDKTIVLWADGTKTIVTCGDGDIFDPYAGFCAAVAKKVFGSTSSVKRALEKHTKKLPGRSERNEIAAGTKTVGGGKAKWIVICNNPNAISALIERSAP